MFNQKQNSFFVKDENDLRTIVDSKTENSYRLKYHLVDNELICFHDYDDKAIIENNSSSLLRLVKKSIRNNLFLITNHIHPLDEEVFNYFKQFRVICVERKNKLDQFLSLCIAINTKQFFSKNVKSIKLPAENSIVVDWKYFFFIFNQYELFNKKKIEIKNPITIYYEDILNLDSFLDFGALLGFNDYRDYVSLDDINNVIGVKQNLADKIKYFKNQKQILEWYEEWITVTHNK
jgi:hypothetical protein|tara:strand:- start:609 stop:1310 length:702 start_codon:yes stop_codon:yes gene_type:complete